MQYIPILQESGKKPGKKVGVILSEGMDHDLSMELLSVLYEGSNMVPVSLDIPEKDESEGIGSTAEDLMKPLIIDVKSEIISPIIPLFDGEMFVLNYQMFYEDQAEING